jgi:hypothetical protein
MRKQLFQKRRNRFIYLAILGSGILASFTGAVFACATGLLVRPFSSRSEPVEQLISTLPSSLPFPFPSPLAEMVFSLHRLPPRHKRSLRLVVLVRGLLRRRDLRRTGGRSTEKGFRVGTE